MMKKGFVVLSALLLSFMLFFFSSIFPVKSFAADCVDPDPGLICIKAKYPLKCQVPNKLSCCTTQQACDDWKTALEKDDARCPDDDSGINTAIGCLHVLDTPEAFLSQILGWAVGIGGGIAFLLIIYAGFMIMTSASNPERLKAGQELLTSAVSGLILLVFSVFILKFIGIDILGLDIFGFGPKP